METTSLQRRNKENQLLPYVWKKVKRGVIMAYTVKRYTFKDGKVMFEDRIAYANGEYVSLDDYEIAMQKKNDEIESLKRQVKKLESIRVRCHESARDSFDSGNYGCLHIVTADELKNTKDNIQKINLNETIKVKLTPYGAEIYYKQFDELNKQHGREICKPQMPRIDKDGYTEFQLWYFIELYGQHIGMCKPNVIEPLDIVYCGNDKCHSDHAE